MPKNAKRLFLALLCLHLPMLPAACGNAPPLSVSVESSPETDDEIAGFLECQNDPECTQPAKAPEGVIRALVVYEGVTQ